MALRKKTSLGVLHVTATSPETRLTMKSLEAMHKQRGWSTTGYNVVIFRGGRREVSARGWDGVGAHVAGFNSIALGIAFEGGVDRRNRADISTIDDRQWATMELTMREAAYRYKGIGFCGHRDLSPDKDGDGIIEPYEWLKECPCFDAIPYAKSLGLKGANIRGTWKEAPVMTGAPVITFIGPDSRSAYLQRLLARAGYVFGPIDGIVGDKTAKAISQFQALSGLPKTGQFDKATVAKLRVMFEAKAIPA